MRIKTTMIDKDLRRIGRLMTLLNGMYTESGLRLVNKFTKMWRMQVRDDTIQFSETWITRKDGSKLRLAIFKPMKPQSNVPGVLWLHGGGYALGMPEQAKMTAKRLIEASNCIVVAPDYRLSVEAPYPVALEDCYEALLWMKIHTGELGVRDDQLMVGGDSAGGGLTAALSLYARDRGEVAIAFQMPLYPMIDDRMTNESAKENNAPVWNSKFNHLGWRLYLSDLFGKEEVPCYAAAARAVDYSGLPPTVTFVGDLEPFRDETVQYVENLRKAGVPVDFEIFRGCYHAFEQMCPKAGVSQRAVAFFVSSFKHAVEHYYAEQNTVKD